MALHFDAEIHQVHDIYVLNILTIYYYMHTYGNFILFIFSLFLAESLVWRTLLFIV
jgi:hypothetical protein